MPNMKQRITKNNLKLLRKHLEAQNGPPKLCNCPKNKICPVGGKCLSKNVIYRAVVEENLLSDPGWSPGTRVATD